MKKNDKIAKNYDIIKIGGYKMAQEDLKRAVELIKKSRKEIGEKRFKELAEEVDKDLKEILGEEKWKVYLAANGSQESEDKLIDEIGKEKYLALLSEINKDMSEKLNK